MRKMRESEKTMSLYVDNCGDEPHEAGLYDLCEWIIDSYPDDIFVTDPKPVIRLRQAAREILALRKQ